MEKEYFFVLKLKNGATLTIWDYILECEAEKKQIALHKHYNALTTAKCSPSEFSSIAGFLTVMKSYGFNGHWQHSPI